MTTTTTNISALANVSAMAISGDNFLCTGSKSYGVSNLPTGTTVTWSLSPASGIANLGCTTCATTTLTRTGVGVVTLTATVTGCGLNRQVTRSVTVGTPAQNDLKIYSDGPTVCRNVSVDFGAFYKTLVPACNIRQTGATNVEWTFSPNPTTIINNSGMGSDCFPVNNSGIEAIFGTLGTYQVQFRTLNACGYSPYSAPYTVQVISGGFCGSGFRVMPNPAEGMVEIALEENDVKAAPDAKIKEITITNRMGVQVKRYTNALGVTKANLNISDLTPGVYVVRISDGKQWKSANMIKK